MRTRLLPICVRVILLGVAAGLPTREALPAEPPPAAPPATLYEFRTDHSPDGIGKFYQGREIAHVMGHEGAAWLERPERAQEEAPDAAVAALKLQPGQEVADLGAGSGYFTWRLARAVGPRGRVYAVDVQPEMLDLLQRAMQAQGVTNVVSVLGRESDPQLPTNRLDLVLMVDVYHELACPHEVLSAVCRALKPGGRVAFIEYRGEDLDLPIKPLHKMTAAQVRREAALHPLEWVETVTTLPRQHLILFRKRSNPAPVKGN